MGINFKYIRKKSNINDFPNTPGKSGKSINGEQGLKGILKPSIHITDYDPSDEYTKNIILGRIDENYSVLKNSSEKILDGYTLNDILITRENDVYKLTEGVGTHKFDLLFLGTMKNRPSNKPEYEKLEEGISYISLNINVNNNYDFTRDLCNRNFDYGVNSIGSGDVYNPFTYPTGDKSNGYGMKTGQRQINGVEIEPLIIASKEILEDYDFILDIYLPNEKSYEPDTINSHVFNLNNIVKSGNPLEFGNSLEFEEEPVHPAFSKNVLFDKKLSIVLQKDKDYKKYFLSDMSCDKLHLYGNEYKTNVTDTIDRTVKKYSKTLYCNDVIIYSVTPTLSALQTTMTKTDPVAVFNENQKTFANGLKYSRDFSYISYCVREDYGGNKDKRFVNFRGGESTYFSSIVPREYLTSDEAKNKNLSDSSVNIANIGADSKYCSFYQYINNVQCTNLSMYSDKDSLFSKEKGTDEWFYALNRNFELRKLIFNEILNFISSKRNKYELRCIHKSGTVYILNIAPDGGKIIWKLIQ